MLLRPNTFHRLCDDVAKTDSTLQGIIGSIGYPPFWTRPNSFATLVLTILEQQVSLASAFAAFTKLKGRVQEVSPENIMTLRDEELRACYFSRQKIVYVRGLAEAILQGRIDLRKFERQPDEKVREELKKLKGIGDWTVDIYLIHALRRTDILPLGDLALVKAIRESKNLDPATTREELHQLAEPWRPYRSVATMILWHYYIRKRNIKIVH
jgi:DNA-3-methyladenine glycosylase II